MEQSKKDYEAQRKLELKRASRGGHTPNVARTAADGTQYTTAPCGAWVRVTKKLTNTSKHNNSVRRRYAKGKF